MTIGAKAKADSAVILGRLSMKGWIMLVEASLCVSRDPEISLSPAITLIAITAIIAPDDAIPTKPKLSLSDAMLSFFSRETPTARASKGHRQRFPVVAPTNRKRSPKIPAK